MTEKKKPKEITITSEMAELLASALMNIKAWATPEELMKIRKIGIEPMLEMLK